MFKSVQSIIKFNNLNRLFREYQVSLGKKVFSLYGRPSPPQLSQEVVQMCGKKTVWFMGLQSGRGRVRRQGVFWSHSMTPKSAVRLVVGGAWDLVLLVWVRPKGSLTDPISLWAAFTWRSCPDLHLAPPTGWLFHASVGPMTDLASVLHRSYGRILGSIHVAVYVWACPWGHYGNSSPDTCHPDNPLIKHAATLTGTGKWPWLSSPSSPFGHILSLISSQSLGS